MTCSRERHPELFCHVVGGYGLFGVVVSAKLRLVKRVQVELAVRLLDIDELMPEMQQRIADGHLYGDFQFATDPSHPSFMRTGVLCSYVPTESVRPVSRTQRRLLQSNWNRLLELAHQDKRRAFEEFSALYLTTFGQLYFSDTHQLNLYLESYHGALDQRLGARICGSEMITELYVPRDKLVSLMNEVRRDFRAHEVNFIYGTIRLIEKDTESALPWARDRWACVIFNVHIDHEPSSIASAQETFRRLIDYVIAFGGSYYLTYHRYARPDQVLACHPGIGNFLAMKQRVDPAGVFQSDWYRQLTETGL